MFELVDLLLFDVFYLFADVLADVLSLGLVLVDDFIDVLELMGLIGVLSFPQSLEDCQVLAFSGLNGSRVTLNCFRY